MPFQAPFKSTADDTDLFYGLAKPRDALMKFLNAPTESQHGHKINYYDVGDVQKGQTLPIMSQEFKKWLGVHPKYKIAVDQTKYVWPHWRVKSKGGLEWATKIKGIDVHFCLDDMMGPTHFSIPLKMYDAEQTGLGPEYKSGGAKWLEKYRAITNAELRWLYRNKASDEVQKHVQFWENNTPCLPPWEQSSALKDLWRQYKDI